MNRVLHGLRQAHRFPEILRCRAATKSWVRLTAAYLGVPVQLPFRIDLRSGPFEMRERQDPATFWQVFFRELYDVRPHDRLIVDAGANIGSFTLYALLCAPESQVVAIEPAPDSCQRVRSMLREHGLSHRCILHEVALDAVEGQTEMSLSAPSHCRTTGEGETRVRTTTLDRVLQPYPRVDLLKMDTAGAEYAVFASTSPETMRKIERIDLEYHPVGDPRRLFEQLGEHGFRLSKHDDQGYGYGTARLLRD